MRHVRVFCALLCALCLLWAGFRGEATAKTETSETGRDAVEALQCVRPGALSSLFPLSGAQVAVIWADYEKERTTVLVADVHEDAIRREITLDGVWDLREQTFSDGRLALCQRDTNTWKFLSPSLEELGEWQAENVDGFFSFDGGTYYFLRDRVLCWQSVVGAEGGKVALPIDLRLLELTAFDARSSTMVMQFFLSPYGSECGTAVCDLQAGEFTLLKRVRYRASFRGEDMCFLSYDNDQMGYSVTYGGEACFFADASLFSGETSDLYAISGSPYLMGIAPGRSILYAADGQISSCSLSGLGVQGEMYSACYLPEEDLLVGAVYQEGAFRLFAMDPARLPFEQWASPVPVASPFGVDEALAESCTVGKLGTPVAENLQEARRYADALEETYHVSILLSSQCAEASALCAEASAQGDHALTLTDTLSEQEELEDVCAMLDALDRSLALYPEGFLAQFQNGAGEGGLCFLLVAHIETSYGAVGCCYERFDWQYIALDVCQTWNRDGVICHEIWHATENHIVSCDYTAFSMDEWDALNPEGFSYCIDPNQMNPEQPWTLYAGSPEEIHFVDSYACVDRHEDRARIMEYIMTHEEEARLLMQSPFIREKQQIKCDAVRSAFDTAGWEDVRWERFQKEAAHG